MKIVIHDFGGYAFVRPLSVALALAGHTVYHLWCGSIVSTPSGDLSRRPTDPSTLHFVRIDLDAPLQKHRYLKRLQQERAYGKRLVATLRTLDADVILSGNTPLDAQASLLRFARQHQIPVIYWLQDLLGVASETVLKKRLWLVGQWIGTYYVHKERRLLRDSAAVVPISKAFLPLLATYGIPSERIHLIENWAELPSGEPPRRDNDWSRRHHLGAGCRFMYAGNLGQKQRASHLADIARATAKDGAEMIVISQGEAVSSLEQACQKEGLTNIRFLPFQPAEDVPQMLAAADVMVALLEPDAGAYCQPSKILTYMAAGKPILASLPRENPAFRLLEDTRCGLPVDAQDFFGLTDRAQALALDPDYREVLGSRALKAAQDRFQIEPIAESFLKVLTPHPG